jgi:deazaflavin-dependent oxidoreductase (nitroreductase family)
MGERGYRGQSEKTLIDRLMVRFAYSRLGGLLFITVFPAIDKRLMKLSGGRVRIAMGQTTLLLHARGAKSGQPRPTPLLYTPHGEDIILVASKAGAAHNPAWYHNLIAHPDVEVELDDGSRLAMRAHEAQGEEREELWRIANDNYLGYQVYQRRAGARRIPVMVLRPR